MEPKDGTRGEVSEGSIDARDAGRDAVGFEGVADAEPGRGLNLEMTKKLIPTKLVR